MDLATLMKTRPSRVTHRVEEWASDIIITRASQALVMRLMDEAGGDEGDFAVRLVAATCGVASGDTIETIFDCEDGLKFLRSEAIGVMSNLVAAVLAHNGMMRDEGAKKN